LKDSERLIDTYHDPHPGSMTQIVLAPCSPFSVTGELMKRAAVLAREKGVQLHTHLAETQDEEQFCLELFGHRPVAYMESLDWVGDDVWFAHSVHVNQDEINVYAQTVCGVAHCPGSNMRLASGIAPIREMRDANVPVGLGVDGSASNDSSHLLAEARQAFLLARVRAGVEGASLTGADTKIMTAREALEISTLGGAEVLGRTDIGSLEQGKCADFIAVDTKRLEYAGALHDPLAALLFCNTVNVDINVIGGEFIVRDGKLQTLDLPTHIEKHNCAAARLVEG